MIRYEIRFIDGHDLRYKVFETVADNSMEAVGNLFNKFGAAFDHAIISICESESGSLVYER